MSVNYEYERKEAVSKFLHTVKYDKRTAFMDPKEEMYWMHFLSRDPLIGDYIKSQMTKNHTFRREVLKQPVCPKCEGFTFFHKGGSQCASEKCGHWSPDQSHTLKKHIREGYYR